MVLAIGVGPPFIGPRSELAADQDQNIEVENGFSCQPFPLSVDDLMKAVEIRPDLAALKQDTYLNMIVVPVLYLKYGWEKEEAFTRQLAAESGFVEHGRFE